MRKEDILLMKFSRLDGLSINQNYCVGCSACVKMLPEVLEITRKSTG